MSEAYKRLIRAIKRQMFKNGMNIKQTAEALGMHRETLSNHLNLRCSMAADTLIRAIDYFDIDVCAKIGIPHEKKE